MVCQTILLIPPSRRTPFARGWDYLYFSGLSLYYAHGRWYNPVIALWLSPNEKGEYAYGSGQDAVNWYVGQFWANAQWGYQQFQRASQATVEPLIAAGKSSPEAKEVVLGAGQFLADTAMASHYAMLPPRNWTLQDRIGNATRATVPVVTAEGMVVFGLPALEETGSYLYRSLLGRLTAGAATACEADPKGCEEAPGAAARVIPDLGNKLEYILGRSTGSPHDVERSESLFKELVRIGLYDTEETRQLLVDRFTQTLNDPTAIVKIQENGPALRESFLMGPLGGVKIQTVWEGIKLITVYVKGAH